MSRQCHLESFYRLLHCEISHRVFEILRRFLFIFKTVAASTILELFEAYFYHQQMVVLNDWRVLTHDIYYDVYFPVYIHM